MLYLAIQIFLLYSYIMIGQVVSEIMTSSVLVSPSLINSKIRIAMK